MVDFSQRVDEWPRKDGQQDQDKVWSAIRYLDPDEQAREEESNTAATIAVLALLGPFTQFGVCSDCGFEGCERFAMPGQSSLRVQRFT